MFQHPNKVCMTYSEHFIISLRFSYIFMVASVKSLIHAFIPDLFISSTTDTLERVNNIMKTNGCTKTVIHPRTVYQ